MSIRNYHADSGFPISEYCADSGAPPLLSTVLALGPATRTPNPVNQKKNRHIRIIHHSIHDAISDKEVELFYMDGNQNPADMFTKNLECIKFEKFRTQLGLVFCHAD